MFIAKNLIRIHDIDLVGLLYFPRQFRLVHEALEDFLSSEGYALDKLFLEKNFLFVIVHCESDYLAPIRIGNSIEVHIYIGKIGTTSFTTCYEIYLAGGIKAGTAKTVHVCLDKETRKKIPIPSELKAILSRHLI